MQGIVIASHGRLCEGILDSLQMFFPGLEQAAACPLQMDADADVYVRQLREAVAAVDTGDGTILFVDLKGGTPSNLISQVMISRNPFSQVEVVTGVNFPMILETCGQRNLGHVDVEMILSAGRSGIGRLAFNSMADVEGDEEIE